MAASGEVDTVPDAVVKSKKESENDGDNESATLKPKLGLINGCTVIIGCIIGSGIFITPGGVLTNTESVGLSLIVWAFCGIISMVGAYCYAELGMTITRSGADYAYIMEAFGPFLAFLRMWVEIIVIRPSLIAIVSLTFAQYVIRPIFSCEKDISTEDLNTPIVLLAAFCILVITFVNCWSIRLTAIIQDVFTYAKVLALLLIIITGIVQLCLGHVQNFTSPWEGIEKTGATKVSLAIYEGLFAYNGWNFLNYVIEELKEPQKNLTKAIGISLVTCTIIYVLTNVAYLTTVSPEDIKFSRAVALMFGEQLYGVMWWIMPVFVSLSCFGTVNGILFTSSRLFFVGAREGHMPIVLNMVSYGRKTPIPAVILIGSLSAAMLIFSSDISRLILYSSFIVWFAVGASVFGLIVLRWTQPNLERPLKVWLGFPILYVIFTMAITIVPVYDKPWEALMGFIILLTGVPVYLLGVVWRDKPRSFTKMITRATLFCQKLFLVVPEQKRA